VYVCTCTVLTTLNRAEEWSD